MRLLGLLGANAVLQRDVEVPVRGLASPGERVTVEFRGQTRRAVADAGGRWCVRMGPFEPGEPDTLSVRCSSFGPWAAQNVLVGEVWVCSGQSNMEHALKDIEGGVAASECASDPGLRLLKSMRRVAEQPCEDLPDSCWEPCTPEHAAAFSGVGYHFGRHLRTVLDVPIGLIQAAVGNTPAESWVSMAVLQDDEDFRPIIERWRRSLADWPNPGGEYARAFERWDQEADRAEREGRPIPGPHPKLVGPGHVWTPSGLFNGMIAPLTQAPIRGVIWWQGAAAPERAFQYRKLFRALIRNWRFAWAQGDFPFLFVQEAAFGPRREEPGEHSWAELREAQAMALAEPNTAMAVAIDCGDEKDIHPRRKEPIGERFALAARAVAYGDDLPWCGPVLESMHAEGGAVRLFFTHTGGGLRTSDARPATGFAVSGGAEEFSRGDRGFVWARAHIEGNAVVVRSDLVPSPVAVRYAWAQNPDCNLVNAAGLPAAPFRTDQWPGVTVQNR